MSPARATLRASMASTMVSIANYGAVSVRALTPLHRPLRHTWLWTGLEAGRHNDLTDVSIWKALVSMYRRRYGPHDEPPLRTTPSIVHCTGQVTKTSNANLHRQRLVLALCPSRGPEINLDSFQSISNFGCRSSTSLAWTLSSLLEFQADPVEHIKMLAILWPSCTFV